MTTAHNKADSQSRGEYDLVIAGGGLVGASLAVALQQLQTSRDDALPLKIAVVEAIAPDSNAQPSYDERTIALTYSSKLIFEAIGVWQGEVEQQACALERIHISNRGHFGICNLDCRDMHTPALGYVVPTRALGQALYREIDTHDNITLLCPATVSTIKQHKNHVDVQVAQDSQAHSLQAKLVVIADGGRSGLLDQLGFVVDSQPYPQQALLSIVSVDRDHQHKAYERFTPAGPLALLPVSDKRYAVVWTETTEEIEQLTALNDEAFIQALQQAFGHRAGLFSQPSPRKAYPLKQSQVASPVQQRTLVLGNAAHTVHPVGGQGFNLSLRDVASFVETCSEEETLITDLGAPEVLNRYAQQRATETKRVAHFTDSLLSIFSAPSPSLKFGRNGALMLIESLPFAKRALLKRTMGMAKHQPKLARGKRLFKAPASK